MTTENHELAFRIGLVVLGLTAVVAGSVWAASDAHGKLTGLSVLRATEISVSSEVAALIREMPVPDGQTVKAGDPLVRLDDDLPQLQFRMAGPIEQQILRQQLSKYVITAPITGVVLRRTTEPGQLASPASPLLVMADLTSLEFTVLFAQRDIARIHPGQSVSVEAEAARGVSFEGRVLSVAATPDLAGRNALMTSDRLDLPFAVKVRMQSGNQRLKPGMSVLARFEES